jgi:hypothetical protein
MAVRKRPRPRSLGRSRTNSLTEANRDGYVGREARMPKLSSAGGLSHRRRELAVEVDVGGSEPAVAEAMPIREVKSVLRRARLYLAASFWSATTAVLLLSLLNPDWSLAAALAVIFGGALLLPALLISVLYLAGVSPRMTRTARSESLS